MQNNLIHFKEQFDKLQSSDRQSGLAEMRKKAFESFSEKGIPTVKHEEWKYTRVSSLFNKDYSLSLQGTAADVSADDIDSLRLPGSGEANELVFINGLYSSAFSHIRSEKIIVLPLEEAAANKYKDVVNAHLGHSGRYLQDGINALNTAFVHGGVFIHVEKGQTPEHPVYIYNITDSRTGNTFSQPRSLMHVSESAHLQIVEIYKTIGNGESLTNQVAEIVMEKDSLVEYYKIQADAAHTNQVSTTHFRQLGKSYLHTVVISLSGNIVRNNLNIVMDADHSEAHLYGLYFLKNHTHVDNHTIVDNVKPNCLSNELYKGIMDENSSGVFNGKIFVQQLAQKTNAYQSNKNILLSEESSVNTKPQLEIFADDVKCSHGCTVGRLNEEGLFYLRSRGLPEKMARALLVNAFALDILEHIKPTAIRKYVDELIAERLNLS